MNDFVGLLDDIRGAYRAGVSAARQGKMLGDMPIYKDAQLRDAWRNGWADAAVHVGMIGTDWRKDRATGD